MQTYQIELETVYKAIHSNGLVNSLIGLSIFIAVIFVAKRIYKAYKDYEGEKDYKVLFNIAKQYALIMLFIVALPFALNKIELVFAGVQSNVSKHFNASVEMSVQEQVINAVVDYKKQEGKKSIIQKGKDALDPVKRLEAIQRAAALMLNTFLIEINKYLYFFFCAGRYLWLLMLEIMAPLALVCILDDNTKQYFMAWLKNMLICYLLIPFFLLADVFGEMAIKEVATHSLIFNFSQYSTLAIVGMLVLKIALYKVAANRAFKLIG